MRSRLSRRDADAFAAAVDGRAPRGREPVFTDRVRELVDVADFVRQSSAPTARRVFVADLRAELMAAAVTEMAVATPVPRRDRIAVGSLPLRRRLTAAASTFVVAGGSLGLVAASAQAMPGDMLYPIKRATEKAELWLRDGSAEGRALLDHAQTRLGEVESLTADQGHETDGLIAQTLAEFTAEANAGGALLLESYRETGSTDDVEDLRAFTAESAQRLADLAGSLPRSASDAYADAAEAVSGLDASAVRVCPTCSGGDPAVTIDGELLATVAQVTDAVRPTDQAGETAPTDRRTKAADPGRSVEAQPPAGVDVSIKTSDRSDQAVDSDATPADQDAPVSTKPDGDPDSVDGVEDTADDITDDMIGERPIGTSVKPLDDLTKPVADAVDGLSDDPLDTP